MKYTIPVEISLVTSFVIPNTNKRFPKQNTMMKIRSWLFKIILSSHECKRLCDWSTAISVEEEIEKMLSGLCFPPAGGEGINICS